MNRYRVKVRQTYELVYELDAENGARAREQVLGLVGAFNGAIDVSDDGMGPDEPNLVEYEELHDKRTAPRAKIVQFSMSGTTQKVSDGAEPVVGQRPSDGAKSSSAPSADNP